MTKKRFSLISVLAMILATYQALRFMATWREGLWIGYPFRYIWWRDTSDHWWQRYHIWAFTADVLIWLAVIVVLGLFVERITQLLSKKYGRHMA